MDSENPNRFDRIVAILIQLQSKKVVKAKELAERFQVSLRTIYRDIRSLEAAGVPLHSEAGSGYSIMEGYRLPPVMFTREEAGSFVAAEKLMEKFTDKDLSTHFQSAIFKIKSVLRISEKEWVDTLDSHITIHPGQYGFNENVPNALNLIFRGVAEKKQIVLSYQSLQRKLPADRYIEPVGVFHENHHWYIMGYCHLRHDYRQFRIDRILDIKMSELPFTRQHGTVEELRKYNEPENNVRVRISVDKQVAKYLEYDRRHFGFVSEKTNDQEKVEMTFHIGAGHIANGFARWFMMFSDIADILEPDDLKVRIREILTRAVIKLEE